MLRLRWTGLILLLAVTLGAACNAQPPQPRVTGRLGEHDGLPVLELWGTPAEAGYAHGYLLAERIVQLIDGALLDPGVGTTPEMYESVLLPAVRRQFAWDPRAEQELDGLIRGLRARLGAAARSARLDRPIEVDDLKLANTLADWRGAGCSTFSVWGELAADNGPLTARNLDYPSTDAMKRSQLVFVYRGDGRTRPWIAVGWPSAIGVYTGMNRDGVTISMHDAKGFAPANPTGLTPRSLVLREALEAAGPTSYIDDVRAVFERRRVLVGNNIHVSGPRRGDGPCAAVFEYDGGERDHGVTLRLADAGLPALTNALFCTNHMRARLAPVACGRYEKLTARLTELTEQHVPLDVPGAFEIITAVATKTTLHSVVYAPRTGKLYVRIRPVQDKVVEFDLAEWFARSTDGAPATAPSGKGVQP